MYFTPKKQKGFSLIEVLIVSAVILLFFGGLFGGVKYVLDLIADGRQKITALTVANEQIELIRSMPYDSVGTVAGIPSGTIPQISNVSLNDIEFERRVLVEYIDDDADGLGGADSNGITTDYKQAKVTVTWTVNGDTKELFLVTNIIPRSIETSVGGGTLRVNVFDADVQPLPGASVRVVNTTIVPNIDVTRSTDATGAALFGGAPAGPDYEIYVTDTGYSSDQTYKASVSLPNPTTLPVAVLEADISTMNFFIDELSNLTIRTLSGRVNQTIDEDFSDMGGVPTSTDVGIVSGSMALNNTLGVYKTTGSFFLVPTTPLPLLEWGSVSVTGTTSANTNILLRFYSDVSTLTLVPDSELPGNSAGFGLGEIDISMIDVVSYPGLTIGVDLSTFNTASTPTVDEITLSYLESESLLSGVALDMIGAKTIGTDGVGNPIYKNTHSAVTASGEYEFSDLEWDDYSVTATGYDISEACEANPISIIPGETSMLDLLLVANTAHSFRVRVETTGGVAIPNASVTLSRTGFSETQTSSPCGQVFFSGLSSAFDYQLDVDPPGYSAQTLTNVGIENDEVTIVQF